jgi:SSS family solute:Na+ symporter
VLVGRIVAVVALITAGLTAKPLLGNFEQAFQYIQDFTGFFTPGICAIFLLGMFWPRCTALAALAAAISSAALSTVMYFTWPSLPFMDRVGIVFLACMGIAIVLSLLQRPQEPSLKVDLQNIDYSTTAGFNIAALVITAVLIVLYAIWW